MRGLSLLHPWSCGGGSDVRTMGIFEWVWEDWGKDKWCVAGSYCLIFPTPAGDSQLCFWGSPVLRVRVGQKEIARCSSLAAFCGERQEKSLLFPKRLWRAEVTCPGVQGQARAGKAALVGKITAHVFSTKPTFLFKFPPCPSYPYNLLSWFIMPPAPAPPKADATQNQSCTSIPTSSSAAQQNSPIQQGTLPYHTHDPTSSTSTSSWRAALARQCPTAISTFPRRRSSARRWGSARTGASGSAASASRSTSLRR